MDDFTKTNAFHLEQSNKQSLALENGSSIELVDTGEGKFKSLNDEITTQNPYAVGVETYKNEWPIPPGTKLGSRPSKTRAATQLHDGPKD